MERGEIFRCPRCGTCSVVSEENHKRSDRIYVNPGYLSGRSNLPRPPVETYSCFSITCLDGECQHTFFYIELKFYNETLSPTIFQMVYPFSANVPPPPPGTPEQIYQTYKEAYLIQSISPTASAVLARKCLEQMIRDFHEIPQQSKRLGTLIKEIEEKISPEAKEMFDSIRKRGNIAAHWKESTDRMQSDIDPKEAELLNKLIYDLFEEWYEARYRRRQNRKEFKEVMKAKQTPNRLDDSTGK